MNKKEKYNPNSICHFFWQGLEYIGMLLSFVLHSRSFTYIKRLFAQGGVSKITTFWIKKEKYDPNSICHVRYSDYITWKLSHVCRQPVIFSGRDWNIGMLLSFVLHSCSFTYIKRLFAQDGEFKITKDLRRLTIWNSRAKLVSLEMS